MTPSTVWDKAQLSLREKIGQTSFETWFSSITVKETGPNSILIEAPDDFFKNWIIEHYSSLIQETLSHAAGRSFDVEFHVNPTIFKKDQQSRLTEFEKEFERVDERSPDLNQRFTFESFVVGPSNRFAHAASLAVAESPAKAYNPLFLYGGVGLGKTHLMQSIANKIHENHPKKRCAYLASEQFTNELIDAIRHRSTAQFRQKYRNIDVLLIDDIHFIAGKESTQEEFFHTFNSLHNERKQIIISSDRPPQEIANLEDRLSSRFAWGLIVDIQPPDFETRVAILRKKLEQEPVVVPDDVVFFIAQEIKRNIRELEGALVRVIAYSLLEEKNITLEMAKTILKDMVKETMKLINIDMIQKAVAHHFRISLTDIKTKKRHRNIVLPRQIAMFLARQLTNLSLPEIGYSFGGKDHTTVLHACKKIERLLKEDRLLKSDVERLIIEIQQ